MTSNYTELLDGLVDRYAAIHSVNESAVQAILADFLKKLHETVFKGSSTDALLGLYYNLGDEASFHFAGVVADCYDKDKNCGDSLSDQFSAWMETIQRFDHRLRRFNGIFQQWSDEKRYDQKLEDERKSPESN